MGLDEGTDLGRIERAAQPADFDALAIGHKCWDDLDAPLVPLRVVDIREVDQVQRVRRTAGEGEEGREDLSAVRAPPCGIEQHLVGGFSG